MIFSRPAGVEHQDVQQGALRLGEALPKRGAAVEDGGEQRFEEDAARLFFKRERRALGAGEPCAAALLSALHAKEGLPSDVQQRLGEVLQGA